MNFGGIIHLNRTVLISVMIFFILIILLYKHGNSEIKIASEYIKNLTSINLKQLLAASIIAAERGGKKVYNVRMFADLNEKSKGKTLEGANNPVTDGDMKSHVEMYHSLHNQFPFLTIISEEKSTHRDIPPEILINNLRNSVVDMLLPFAIDEHANYKDVVVWIDPLDATQEYTENLKEYVTTMVCVAVKGRPVIGVIHKPFLNKTSWAWVGHTFHSTEVVKSKENNIPKSLKVIISRSHKGEVEKAVNEVFGDVTITAAGGAGYKILEVLRGTQDVYIHTSMIKKWDTCAGNAILEYFGGKMTALDGTPINYSKSNDVINQNGLIGSLYNHNYYIKKLLKLNAL